jgi:hypothetical protein
MSKYSFLLQGTETEYAELSPTLRLRKYGGWLVAEAIEQEELSKAQSQATIRAVQLAKRIATVKGIELDAAFELLQGGGGMDEMDLLSDFTDDTLAMLSSSTSMELSNAKLVTVFMRCRGEALMDGSWKSTDDWTLDDTKLMGRPMISQALEFIAAEQAAEVKPAKKAQKAKAEVPAAEPSN